MDWSDLRYVTAVAASGSTLAAAQRLRISQPTVARRLAALEAALGLSLFERHTSGYRLTKAGAALLPPCKRWSGRCTELTPPRSSSGAACQVSFGWPRPV